MKSKFYNGVVLYRGPSRLNGKPIVAIATGLRRKSKNEKTGPLVQVFIMDGEHNPMSALWEGMDSSVCGHCKHRPRRGEKVVRRWKDGDGKNRQKTTYKRTFGSCYVNVSQSVEAVWQADQRQAYPEFHPGTHGHWFRDRIIRWGAYGDPAAIPLALIRLVMGLAKGGRAYSHQWATKAPQGLSEFSMASVDNVAEKAQANAMGWRTFRIGSAEERPLPDEFVCPASEEGGHRSNCEKCKACSGTQFPGKNVFITVHGDPRKVKVFETVQLSLARIPNAWAGKA